jgi:hypothetical protein
MRYKKFKKARVRALTKRARNSKRRIRGRPRSTLRAACKRLCLREKQAPKFCGTCENLEALERQIKVFVSAPEINVYGARSERFIVASYDRPSVCETKPQSSSSYIIFLVGRRNAMYRWIQYQCSATLAVSSCASHTAGVA